MSIILERPLSLTKHIIHTFTLKITDMSRKYKFRDNSQLYFVSFATVNWIDVFIRNEYKEVLLDSLRFCQLKKDLELYAWCIMTSHLHLIIGSRCMPMEYIMRDFKSYTSTMMKKTIKENPAESRKEWMLWMPAPFFRGLREPGSSIRITKTGNSGSSTIIPACGSCGNAG